MGGAEQEKRRLTLRTPKASRFGGFRKQEDSRMGSRRYVF